MTAERRGTRAIVNLSAIANNVRVFREAIGNSVELMAVVKADGYGHGAIPVARAAIRAGASWLGVAVAEEGAVLRDAGIDVPILVLGPSNFEQTELAVSASLDMTVFEERGLSAAIHWAGHFGRQARVHLKVDTGMGRVGIPSETAVSDWIPRLRDPRIRFQGLMSHLADSDAEDPSYTRRQVSRFLDVIEAIRQSGSELPPVLHLANSAAALKYPGTHFNLVRVGIGLYGVETYNPQYLLQPALSWESRVTFVKRIAAGDSVGYGRTYVARENEVIATIAIGYADGYRRTLSNRAEVLLHGKRCAVVGRVSMDQLTVRVPANVVVSVGDSVVLIGQQGSESISAADLAQWSETISYEILTGVGPRVPRVYRED